MVMEACPSSSETTFTLTPSLNSSVAHVCRRSWKRRSSRTLARALIRLKERLRRFEGLNGEPVSLGKTRPWSCQSPAKRSRSSCKRAPHEHGGLGGFEAHVFPTQGQQLAFTQTAMGCQHVQSLQPLST